MKKLTFKIIIALALLFSATWQVQAEDIYCNDFGQVISDNTRGWDATNFTVFNTTTSIDVKLEGDAIIREGDLYRGIANAENVVNVYKENEATIVLKKGSASFNWIHFAAYADWNADGIFNPMTEKLFFDTGNNNVDRTYTIEVPANAALGQTRIRIIMGWFIHDTDETLENYYSPCKLVGDEDNNFMPKNGRVFDFLINIKDASEGALLALKAKLIKAKALTNLQYPIGIVMGTYPQAKWDALQAAILVAEEFVKKETVTDEEIATNNAALQLAIDNLNESMVLPFKVSSDARSHWYHIRDMRDPMNYMQIAEYTKEVAGKDPIYVPVALVLSQEENQFGEEQLFKIVKAEAPSKGYLIFNKLMEDTPLSLIDSLGLLQIEPDSAGLTWQFGTTKNASHFTIFREGLINKQLNSSTGSVPPYVGFYYPGAGVHDNGNAWEFVELIESGQTDFRGLIALLATATRMTSADYPIGTGESQFPVEKWNAFVAVRTAATALVAKETEEPQPTQTEVDEMIVTLQTAIDELKAAQNDGFFASNETVEHWYTVNDKRDTKSYWKVKGFANADSTIVMDMRLMMVKGKPAVITDSLMFKLVKAEEPLLGYYLYSKLDVVNPIVGQATNLIGVDTGLPAASWLIDKSTNLGFYIISLEATLEQLNSYANATPAPHIGYWAGGSEDPGNNWKFTPAAPATSVKNVKVSDLIVYVINRTIVTANQEDRLTVYNISGQKMNINRQLTPGVYIVRAEGKQTAVKVMVR